MMAGDPRGLYVEYAHARLSAAAAAVRAPRTGW
jgi:hypothetical protein